MWLKPSTERRRTEDDTKKLTTGRSELSIHVEMCPVRAEKIPHENKLSMNTLVFRASSHKDRQLAKEETGAHRTQHTVTALAKNQSVPHQSRANDRACYLNGNKYRAANSTAPDSTTTIFCRRGVSRGACNASILYWNSTLHISLALCLASKHKPVRSRHCSRQSQTKYKQTEHAGFKQRG